MDCTIVMAAHKVMAHIVMGHKVVHGRLDMEMPAGLHFNPLSVKVALA